MGARAAGTRESAAERRRGDQACATCPGGGFEIGDKRLGQQEKALHLDAQAGGPFAVDRRQTFAVFQGERMDDARERPARTQAIEHVVDRGRRRPVNGQIGTADDFDTDSMRGQATFDAARDRDRARRRRCGPLPKCGFARWEAAPR